MNTEERIVEALCAEVAPGEEVIITFPVETKEVHIANFADLPKFTEVFKKRLGDVIFRRVAKVSIKGNFETFFYAPDPDTGKVIEIKMDPITSIPDFKDKEDRVVDGKRSLKYLEHLQNMRYETSRFEFQTETAIVRKNDKYKGQVISGVSSHHAEIDILNASFEFKATNTTRVPPRTNLCDGNSSDLICGLVEKNKLGLHYKKWFICSEQFLRLWTMICAPEEFAKTPIPNNKDSRRWFMSGNRFCTNGFRKYKLQCDHHGLSYTPKKLNEYFYDLRTESIARDYVHVYAALALLVQYGELPGQWNIPYSENQEPFLKGWDLPITHDKNGKMTFEWFLNLIELYEIRWETKFLQVSHPVCVVRKIESSVSSQNEEPIVVKEFQLNQADFPSVEDAVSGKKSKEEENELLGEFDYRLLNLSPVHHH